jgi:hypothetical protein
MRGTSRSRGDFCSDRRYKSGNTDSCTILSRFSRTYRKADSPGTNLRSCWICLRWVGVGSRVVRRVCEGAFRLVALLDDKQNAIAPVAITSPPGILLCSVMPSYLASRLLSTQNPTPIQSVELRIEAIHALEESFRRVVDKPALPSW